METKIRKIQTAIFLGNFSISNDLERASFLTEIHEHTKSIFNGAPKQFPIPNDAPPEFPRVILNSSDGKFTCNVSLSRADVFYNIPDGINNLEQLLQIQKNNVKNIFIFFSNKGVIVNRVGFVTVSEKTLSSEEGDTLNYLRNTFIQGDKFNNPKELAFTYNQLGRSDNFEMNNLIAISAKLNSNIVMQTDINTVAEIMMDANFNTDILTEIMDYSINKTQQFINNFPSI